MITKNQITKFLPKFSRAKFQQIICFLAVIFFSFSAKAQTAQDVADQQDWLTRQQQNTSEDKKRTLEFEMIKKDHERKKEEDQQSTLQPTVSGKMKGDCVAIKKINLLDAKSLSSASRKKITTTFIGKCVEAEVLAAIIKALNDEYHAQGFITVQITVPKQNLQSGIFDLQIIEGKIEKISLGKDRIIEKTQKFTAFGSAEGKALNIDDINQGIYQMNRLQSNQAVMKVEPGTVSGDSKIIIDNNKKFPASFTAGKDNLGNNFTGVQRANFSSSFDNLLFLNDNLNLNYATNLRDDSSSKELKSFSSSFSIPFKYNTFSYDFSRSEYKGHLPNQTNLIALTGFSQSSKFSIDRVLLNRTSLRLSTSAALTKKQAASYQDGVKQDSSARNLSVLNLAFAASSYLNETTSIYLKPSYSKGLKILNAKQDSANESGATTKAQFEYFKLYANFSKKLTIPQIAIPFTFVTEMDSQYSKQTLYGSEQFSVGGYYSVRGFREGYITGDSGYYFRNKVNVNLASLVAPFTQKNSDQNSANKNLAYLNKIAFEPFYDYGYTKYKYIDQGADGRLSGAGIKTIFSSKYFTSSLTYSWAINKSRLITATTKENKLLYFEFSASCC